MYSIQLNKQFIQTDYKQIFMKNQILQALNSRYATQVFDPKNPITTDELNTILEAGRLSPSSIGLEPWKFIVVENPEIRAKLREAGYNQPKITDASYLIVIAYRTDTRENILKERLERVSKIQNVNQENLDPLKQMIEGALSSRSDAELDTWIKAQAYIPLGIMIETAALLNIDSGPMEGFDANKVDEILGLKAKNLHATSMLALGHRGDDPAALRPKVRQSFEEAVMFIK